MGCLDSTDKKTVLPELTMSPHIVDCGGAAVDVGEAPESAVGADRDVVRNAKEAMSDRRILTQRKAEN